MARRSDRLARIFDAATSAGIVIPALNIPYLPMMEAVTGALVECDAFSLVQVARLEITKFEARSITAVAEEYRPNYLCSYLYELAGHFTRFYEVCPVLKAEQPTRASRLVLCDLAAQVLKQGAQILGIETLEQM